MIIVFPRHLHPWSLSAARTHEPPVISFNLKGHLGSGSSTLLVKATE